MINEKENAIKNYQKALEIDPSDELTREVLNTITK
jgi:predicted negative regulator of RcsB-dependent stress response